MANELVLRTLPIADELVTLQSGRNGLARGSGSEVRVVQTRHGPQAAQTNFAPAGRSARKGDHILDGLPYMHLRIGSEEYTRRTQIAGFSVLSN